MLTELVPRGVVRRGLGLVRGERSSITEVEEVSEGEEVEEVEEVLVACPMAMAACAKAVMSLYGISHAPCVPPIRAMLEVEVLAEGRPPAEMLRMPWETISRAKVAQALEQRASERRVIWVGEKGDGGRLERLA